uniref:Transposase-associated domain-containing protein n=1 Tax=Fagus sylvatica TaxID=28930 RepID=A0A2N9GHE4_FAGSY
MSIDKTWMFIKDRRLPEWQNGMKAFLDMAFAKIEVANTIRCPCRKCVNVVPKTRDEVALDLCKFGMDQAYKRWIFHGEELYDEPFDDNNGDIDIRSDQERCDDANAYEMINNMIRGENLASTTIGGDDDFHMRDREEPNDNANKFYRLLWDAEQKLYPSCKTLTKLSFVVRLFQMKCLYGWSDKSIEGLLELFRLTLPDGHLVLDSLYSAKKIIRDLGLNYEKIDACINDCVLYRNEYASLEQCPICMESRWKSMENNAENESDEDVIGKNKNKKKEGQVNDDVLRHPANSMAWKRLDEIHSWFALDYHNIKLGLTTDGFNPFGPFWIMSMFIPGPKSPGNDIDVYLQPLIDELKQLWEHGVETYDASLEHNFRLHAAVLWTINDFPAYAVLSGWSTKGELACPSCHKDTWSSRLKYGRKHCYMGHRRFLESNHTWRKNKSSFDNTRETRQAPKPLSGDEELSVEELDRLDHQIAKILCKLEQVFPPSFFDVMMHLPIHLAYEAKVASSVQYRWMYPIERYLRTLKGYVRNKARPEGSIAEGYISEECMTFCSWYLHDMDTKFNRPERNVDASQNEATSGLSVFASVNRNRQNYTFETLSKSELQMAHHYILTNCEEIAPWVENQSRGYKKDEYGFINVDVTRLHYKDDPFILGIQAEQVYYAKDVKNPNWCAVIRVKPRNLFAMPNKEQEVDDENNISAPAPKRSQGALKGLKVAKKASESNDGKLSIMFSTKLSRPIEVNCRSFVDEVVVQLKHHLPLIGVKNWKEIPQEAKNTMKAKVLERWRLADDDFARAKIFKIAQERYRGWRADLSATHKAYAGDMEALIRNKPEELDIEEWKAMIAYFETDDFKRDRETQKEPDALELWAMTYCPKGQWVNNDDQHVYDEAKQKIAEVEEKEGRTLSSNERDAIFQSIVISKSKSKSRYVRGQGYMSRPPTSAERVRDEVNNEIQSLRRLLETECAERAEERVEREAQIESLRAENQTQLESLRQSMREEFMEVIS